MAFGDTIAQTVLGKPSAPEDTNSAPNTVAEGAVVNTTVGITAHSTFANGSADVDYSLSADSSGGGFKVDAVTGVVTVADPSKIDFESAPGHLYTITVLATKNDSFSSEQTFTIGVTDIAPSAPVDTNATANAVLEGAATGTLVGITASSTDVNGGAVTYALTGDTSAGGFTINATTGVVSVADGSKIDFESAPGHAYTVTVQSSDGTLTSSQAFTINVGDVSMTTPVDVNGTANNVTEGAVAGTMVGITASATDPSGPAPTYSLIGDTSGGGFTINASTGVVTVANPAKIDFESSGAGHSYNITVQASNGVQTTSQVFTVGVTDAAPSAPTDSNGAANTVVEGAANGTAVGVTASSTDVNGGALTYSLVGDTSGGGFTINSTTGVITVADSTKINYETAPSHAYTVTARASDGTLSFSQAFAIAVTDVAPSAPVDSNGATNTVAEGAANGSTVGVTAFSTDVNGPGVTYSLVGDTSGGGFTINSTTGVVTVADSTKLDYETTPGHAYTITAQASDGTLTNSQSFSIAVTDVAPSAPTDVNAAANTVAEGAANGSTVGITASSVDPNGPATTYSLTDSAGGRFAINSSTGVVTVANGAAIDFETAVGHAYGITVQATNGALTTSSAFSIGVTDVGPSTATDSNGAANSVFEGAANGTAVGITASSTDPGGGPAPTYTLTDSAGGRFAINSTTGVVTVANGAAIDYETAPGAGHSYGITVQSTAGALSSTQNFSIAVGDVNEAPAGTDKTVTMLEGDSYVFSVADFGFTDPSDSVNPNSLLAVKMTTVPGAGTGTFTNNGVTVNAGDSVSAANIAAGLLVFTPTAHSNGAPEATFTFQVQDNGGTANGGVDLDQSPNTVTINVNAVNDAPINSVPGTQSVNEEGTLTFSTGTGNAITISDVDVGSGNETVTLTVTGGTLALGSTAGLVSFTNNAASINLTGTVANVNAAMNGLTYTGNLNFNGADSLVVSTNDNGNTGAGGPKIDSDSITINVAAVNDAPVNGVPGAQTVNEDTNLVFTGANAITISDVDANGSSETVTLSVASGALTLNGTTGLSFTVGDGTADSTMTFSGTVAAINTALNGLIYKGNLNFNGSDTLSITTNDGGNTGSGGALSDADSVVINVSAVNDAPVNTVPGAQTVNEDTTLVFNGANTISIADVDVGAGNETVTLSVASGALTLNGTAGLAFTVGDGTSDSTMTFSGTVAAINTALNGLSYKGNLDFNGSDTLNITTNDNGNTGSGGAQSDADSVVINVSAVNDAPVNTVPGTQTVNEDTTLVFNGANTISIADVDAGAGTETVTLSVASGALTLNGTTGLAFTVGDGTSDSTMTFTGTVSDINAALNGLSYKGNLDFNGSDTLNITTNDNGNTGSGGALSDADSVVINVSAVNDAPVNTVSGAQTVDEDTALVFNGANTISIADVDAGAGTETVTLSVANGALTLNGTAGLVFGTGDGTADSTMTFTGTVAAINTALNGLSYKGNLNFNGSDTLNITTNDNGNTGSGGAQSDADSVAITINAVNDAPTLTATGNNPNYVAGGVDLFSGVTASTGPANESTQLLSKLVLTVTNISGTASDFLTIDGTEVDLTDTNSLDTTGPLGVHATVSVAGSTATVTLTSTGLSDADMQTLVDGLSYTDTTAPGALSRVVTLTSLQDNGGTSPGVDTATLSITSTVSFDAAPTITGGATISYVENDAATQIDNTIVVADTDDTFFESATVKITSGFASGQDVLSATTAGTSIVASFSGDTLTLTGHDTLANYQAVLRSVKYQNTSEDPSATDRVATYTVNDGTLDSTPITSTIHVAPVNDQPTLSATGLNPGFTENGSAVDLYSTVAASTIEAGQNLDQLILTVTNVAGTGATESLLIDGTTVELNNGNSETTATNGMTASVSLAGGTATVTVAKSGGISAGAMQTLVDGLAYGNTSDDPGAASRAVTITSLRDTGSNTAPNDNINATLSLQSTVAVTPVNDAPTLTATSVGGTFTEPAGTGVTAPTGSAVDLFSTPHASTVEAGQAFTQVVVTVSNILDTTEYLNVSGTAVDLVNGNSEAVTGGIASVAIAGGTATVTINATTTFTQAQVESLVDSLAYDNNDDTPTATSHTVTITSLTDNGGTANGGTPTASLGLSASVTVVATNDAPTAASFNFSANSANDAIGNTSLVLDDTSVPGAPDPAGPQKTINGSLLVGASDVDGPGPLVTVAQNNVATTHGHVTVNTSGEFSYTPNAGYIGTDTFNYQVSDQNPGTPGLGTGTVTVNVATPKVWYVNADAATDGDGTSANPFNTLTHFDDAGDNVDGAGDTIFLYNASAHYTGGLTLENNEKLIGQSQGLTVNGTALEAAAGTNSGTIIEGGVVLGQSDTISGVTLGNTGAGVALTGTNFVTFNVDHTAVNTDNNGMILTNGAFGAGATFTSFTSGGATDVSLTNVTGSVDLGTGTMSGQFAVNGGSVSTTYSGNLSQANNAAMLDVSGGHTGTLTFQTGTLSATNGTGLQFANADGTYNFNGTTTLNGGNAGIDILAGTDAVNGSQGTFSFGSNTSITSPTGTALNIDASNAAVTYGGTITQNNAANAVSVTNEKGTHTVDINGLVTANTSTATGVNLTGNSSGTTVQFDGGLNIDTTSGTGFNATGGGTIRVSATGADESINSTGATALNLNGMTIGAIGLNFDSTTSGGGTAGVSLDTVTGTGDIVLGSGTLSGHSGAEFDINAGSGNVSYGGTIGNGTGDSVQITSHTSGTVALSGAINDTNDAGGGIVLTNNSGGTITFSNATQTLNTGASDAVSFTNTGATGAAVTFSGGNLNIDTTSGKGLNATSSVTGAGSLTVTGANNSIATGSGTALTVDHVNIGASNITFHDISANGAASGIILNTTGSSGHLAVTGGGSVAQGGDFSGGIIQNTTGAGISLTSTTGVTLNNMKIQTTVGDGVDGTAVHSFTFTNGTIDKSGLSNALAVTGTSNTSNIGFNSNQAGSTNNVDGTVTITNNVLNEALYHGVQIFNRAGTLSDVNISNNSLTSTTSVSTSLGQGVHVVAFGDASGVANVTKAEINNNSIHNFPVGVGLEFQAGNSSTSGPGGTAGTPGSATNIIQIDNNTIAGASAANHIGSEGMVVSIQGGNSGSRGNANFEINGNNISNVGGFAVSHSVFGFATATSTVNNNIIDANQPANSGSGGLGIGTSRSINGNDTPNLQVTISGNNTQHTDGNGILLLARDATGTVNAKVINNTVGVPNGEFEEGIRVDSGNINSVNETMHVQISGNTTTGSFSPSFGLTAPGIGVRKEGTNASVNTFGIVGLSPSPATAAQTEVYIGSQNPNSSLGSAGASHTGNPERADVISGSNFVSATLAFMLATDGGVAAATPGQAASTGDYHLTQAELDTVVAAAIGQWAAAGASATQLAALHSAVFSVADLAGTIVGQEAVPGQITIDTDANGHGWFVDATPNSNSEFTHAQNAAGTDLYTDPTNAAAGHLDLLTVVSHELGHVLGLDDTEGPSDTHGLMYINLADGERRVPDASDVAHANDTTVAQAIEASMPLSARAAAGTPVITGTPANDTIDAGHGGNILFGGAGADNFVFGPATPLDAPTPAQVTHVADYHAAEGDTFDFSAITSAFHNSSVNDALVVRAVEDASGKFATLQVDHIDPTGLPSAPNWVNVAQLDGAHAGDAVNVLIDNHSVHLAQIHVDLLV